MSALIKWSSLTKSVRKFTQKNFMRLAPSTIPCLCLLPHEREDSLNIP
jgi:hypothetical protein